MEKGKKALDLTMRDDSNLLTRGLFIRVLTVIYYRCVCKPGYVLGGNWVRRSNSAVKNYGGLELLIEVY